ncbi:hypothetical protein D3C73_597870 [compost metagenome]
MQGAGGQARVEAEAFELAVEQYVDDDVRGLFVVDAAQNAVDEFVKRHLDLLRNPRRVLQTAVGQQLKHKLIELTDVIDQPLQAFAAGGRQVVGQGQRQAKIQPCQRCAQFMGDCVEQITLLVQQVLDVAGHGVEDVGQTADVGTRGNLRALAQVALAKAFRRAFQTFQVAPVRAQPQQQAREHGRADQHVDAPVQQADVHRVRRHDHLHHGALVQWCHCQSAPAPVADPHNVLAALQSLLLIRRQAAVIVTAEHDVQRIEVLVHFGGQGRPLFDRGRVKLFDDQRLQASGVIEVVGNEALMKDLDHQIRHQINRRAERDDGHQVQAKEDSEHRLSIPTRNG